MCGIRSVVIFVVGAVGQMNDSVISWEILRANHKACSIIDRKREEEDEKKDEIGSFRWNQQGTYNKST